MSDVEKDFEAIAAQIKEKLLEAGKLITEADELAGTKTLKGVDPDACDDLQTILKDVGFVTEIDNGWSSSNCW